MQKVSRENAKAWRLPCLHSRIDAEGPTTNEIRGRSKRFTRIAAKYIGEFVKLFSEKPISLPVYVLRIIVGTGV